MNGTIGRRAEALGAISGSAVAATAEILYTSIMLQMAHGLVRAEVPDATRGNNAKAWRRSWMLGFCSAVIARIKAAETAAASTGPDSVGGQRQRPECRPGPG